MLTNPRSQWRASHSKSLGFVDGVGVGFWVFVVEVVEVEGGWGEDVAAFVAFLGDRCSLSAAVCLLAAVMLAAHLSEYD
mgnify:CR=1 FL=1